MNKSTFLTSLALVTVLAIVLIFLNLSEVHELPSVVKRTNEVVDLRAESSAAESKVPPERAALAVTLEPQSSFESNENLTGESDTVATDSVEADAEATRHVASLTAMLQEEQSARRRLESKLAELETTLASLERRLTTLISDSRGNSQTLGNSSGTDRGGVDTESLMAAGFSAPEAENLAQRWGQQQMDLLYLRDQAIREGWIDTPRYREAAQDLRDGNASLREELGDDAYDRLLYASGQPNRLAITSVFESSPGQVSGLQPGDVIISYDGTPVRSGSDVRDATTDGDPGEPVMMEILRDGQPIEINIPRGPIGIQMDAVSVAPD